MSERPNQGEQIAGIAGVALFLIMFLFAWYAIPHAPQVNGLDAFDAYSDWLDIFSLAKWRFDGQEVWGESQDYMLFRQYRRMVEALAAPG